jgi:hypothetical protein
MPQTTLKINSTASFWFMLMIICWVEEFINTESLVAASKEFGLEVNADKT